MEKDNLLKMRMLLTGSWGNGFKKHNHIMVRYGNDVFLIRECENRKFKHYVGYPSGTFYIEDEKLELDSSEFTSIRIKNPEQESTWRKIEEEQIREGEVRTLKL